jgi:hypothetical protein
MSRFLSRLGMRQLRHFRGISSHAVSFMEIASQSIDRLLPFGQYENPLN